MQIGEYKISDNGLWIIPFCRLAAPLVPRMKYLREIILKKPRLERINHCKAITHRGKREYYITIHTHRVYVLQNPPYLEYSPYNTMDILHSLAHELAHLTHWAHTVGRMELEIKIMARFMRKLKRDGYKSEEKDPLGRFYLPGG